MSTFPGRGRGHGRSAGMPPPPPPAKPKELSRIRSKRGSKGTTSSHGTQISRDPAPEIPLDPGLFEPQGGQAVLLYLTTIAYITLLTAF